MLMITVVMAMVVKRLGKDDGDNDADYNKM